MSKEADAIREATREINAIVERLRYNLMGTKPLIVGNYNGQPFGSSRPNLKGKVVQVVDVQFDCDRFCLWIEGQRVSLRPEMLDWPEEGTIRKEE